MTPSTSKLTLILIALLLASAGAEEAHAARDTDIPAFLHGEVGVGFSGMAERSRMFEYAVRVGKYREGEVGPNFHVRFGFLPGAELFGDIPIVTTGYRSYAEVSAMEPCSYGADGSYQSGPNCNVGSTIHLNPEDNQYVANDMVPETPSYRWSGLDDVVVGVRFTPFHEKDMGSFKTLRKPSGNPFPDLASWRLEMGAIINTGGNFYQGGPGAGANGIMLGTSFSKTLGLSDPYLLVRTYQYGRYDTTYTDPNGQTSTVSIMPPDETVALFGVELIPFVDVTSGAKFVVDFAFGGHHWSKSTVVSGTVLPSVIDEPYDYGSEEVQGTAGMVVGEEARVGYEFRLRLQYQLFRYLRVDALGDLMYVLPHRLESPYRVLQGHTAIARYGVSLTSTF